MADQEITIGINVDAEGAVTGIEEVEGATVSMETEGGEAGMEFGRTMEVALGNLAADAARELMGALQDLVSQGMDLLGDSLDNANVQRLLDDKLRLALDNAGEAADREAQKLKSLASELQRTTDFSNEQIQAAQALFITYGASADGAARLSSTVADLAAFASAGTERTVSLNRAARTLGRTMDGSTESLQRLGVQLDEATKQGIEAAEGMERVELVAEALDEKVGGAAEELSTEWKGLQEDVADLSKEFGQELLPIALQVSEQLRELAQDEETKQFVRETAQEVANLLTEGIQKTGQILGLFAEYQDKIGQAAAVTWRLTKAVTAYVAGVKAYALWTRRAVVWQKAATRAQWAFNAALNANPLVAVATGLAALIVYMKTYGLETDRVEASTREYWQRLKETKKQVDELSESTQNLTEQERKLRLERLKDQRRNALETLKEIDLQLTETRKKREKMQQVQQGGARVSATYLSKLNAEIEALEDRQEEAEGVVQAASQQIDKIRQQSEETDDNTDSTDDNTDAQQDNAAARREAAGAIREQVQAQDELLNQDVGGFNRLLEAASTGQVEEALRTGLVNSIQAADDALSSLQKQYDRATTDQARREIQALIDKLREHRDELEATQEEVLDLGPALERGLADALTTFAEGVGEMMVQAESAENVGKKVVSSLASLAQRVGSMMVGFGVSALALQQLISNPAGAIAAGTALIALASAAKAAVQDEIGSVTGGSRRERRREPNVPSFQSGVEDFQGGLARVHEDELLVNLAAGTSVLPSGEWPHTPITSAGIERAARAGGGGSSSPNVIEEIKKTRRAFQEKQFRQRGTDLVTVQERTQAIREDAGIE